VPSSRPESRTMDQRLAISYQSPFIEPPYRIARKQLKVSIAQFPQGFFFFLIFRLQLAALIVRRPKHPRLTMLYHNISWRKKFLRVSSNLEHHIRIRERGRAWVRYWRPSGPTQRVSWVIKLNTSISTHSFFGVIRTVYVRITCADLVYRSTSTKVLKVAPPCTS
jgi:hypothetical protein